MKPPTGPVAVAAAALLWLAVFSLLFTAGSAIGLWPSAADARLGQLDLPIGLAVAVSVGAALLWPRRERPDEASRDAPSPNP